MAGAKKTRGTGKETGLALQAEGRIQVCSVGFIPVWGWGWGNESQQIIYDTMIQLSSHPCDQVF